MIDFDAYLRRIGLDPGGNPAWQAVHRAHATSIPFENLDSHRGIPVSLEQDDLERKLVASGRGGYCFEHNLLLASALEHMGLQVEPMLARVGVGGAAQETRPVGHLALRVTDVEGLQWHADVGFGLGTLLDPIPFGPSGVHEQSGWSFRVVEDGRDLAFQTLHDFSGPLVSLGMSPAGTESTEVPREAVPSLLAQRFGLPGWGLGPDDRVVALHDGGRLCRCLVTRAQRPGYRPQMHPGDGTDRLSEALAELRDAERW
ncbi:MAG TPA: arylamine N-acetyltransferase [Streptosporangiaceae bacterium]|jgi:hypothetical protein